MHFPPRIRPHKPGGARTRPDPAERRRRPTSTRAAWASPRTLAPAGALALLALLLSAAPASAHDVLESATPASGSTVTSASTVTLTFEAPPVDLGGHKNGIIVTDSGGRHYETSCASVSGDLLTAPVRLGAAGTYSVQWRAVSPDGHLVGNTYTFTYQPSSSTTAAPGSATGPSCGATGGATAATEIARNAAGASTLPLVIGAASGVVLLAVIAALLVVVLRLRRTQGGDA